MKLTKLTLMLLCTMILLSTFAAAGPIFHHTGTLDEIEKVPGQSGPDSKGRYEYTILMKNGDQEIYFGLWMTPDDYEALKQVKGQRIRIYYEWEINKWVYLSFVYALEMYHQTPSTYPQIPSTQP